MKQLVLSLQILLIALNCFSQHPTALPDDFESYTTGQQLAQQNPILWTTWSNAPGGTEDPYASSDAANSGMNSVVIETGNDLVLPLGDLTSGYYNLTFKVMIPTGFTGYYNVLHMFDGGNSEWGTQVYFGANGQGSIDGGAEGAATFTYAYDTWITVANKINLTYDSATVAIDGIDYVTWQWSMGTFGDPGLNQLGAANFYAWDEEGTPKMYIDDIDLIDLGISGVGEPPVNLTGTIINDNYVQLAWNEPGTGIVLWDQIDPLDEPYGKSAQDFESDYDNYDAEVCGDFVLTESATINKFATRFYYNSSGSGNIDPRVFNVAIFADESGIPAETPLYTTTTVECTPDENNVFAGDLVDPIALDAGTYWVGYSMQLVYGEIEIQCYVNQRAATDNGTPAYWRNPGDGFGTGFTNWSQDIASQGGVLEDVCFAIYGAPATAQDLANMNNYNNVIVEKNLQSVNLNVTTSAKDNNVTPANPVSRDLLGYNVYRNGSVIAEEISNLTYYDGALDPGSYNYHVTAVYTEGESAPAGPVTVEIPGCIINVNPDTLSANLIYPNTVAKTMTIYNNGFENLMYEIWANYNSENKTTATYKPHIFKTAPTGTGELVTAKGNTIPVYEGGKTRELLWENAGNIGVTTSGLVSGGYGGVGTTDNLVNAADDFIIPMGQTWTIEFIHTEGFTTETSPVTPDGFGVIIYGDSFGAPSDSILFEEIVPWTDYNSQDLVLNMPPTLTSGHYWLSVYAWFADATNYTDHRWNWYYGTTPVGYEAVLQDQPGLFGGMDWTKIGPAGLGIDGASMYFVIEGSVASDDCWLSFSPLSGSILPGDSVQVNVLFDPNELDNPQNNTYYADILIHNNDVTQPIYSVIAEMTLEGIENYDPPINLTAQVIDDTDIQLTWEAPGAISPESWISYFTDLTHYSWLGPERSTLFNVTDFGAEYPVEITQLSHTFYEHPDHPWGSDVTFTFKVYDTDGATMLYESTSVAALGYPNETTLVLDEAIPVDGDFYLAIATNSETGMPSSAAFEDHTNSHGYIGSSGSWVASEMEWSSRVKIYTTASDVVLQENTSGHAVNIATNLFAIDTIVKSISPSNRTSRNLLGYRLYRNNFIIADSITNLTYLDTSLTPGSYTYLVSALYTEGESDPAGPVTVEINLPDISVSPTTMTINESGAQASNTAGPTTHDKNLHIDPIDFDNSRIVNIEDKDYIAVLVPGGYPPKQKMPVAEPTESAVMLSNVPAFDWCFGCSATSAAMYAGFHDNNAYPDMYSGPTNGGVCPMDNSSWGTVVISGEIRSLCPLSATMMNLDGRTTRGNVDDYWIEYGHPGPDPFITNGWTEHTAEDCTADFMKTSQSEYNCTDGSTWFHFGYNGTQYTGSNSDDGGYGVELFCESRGYTVTDRYNQYIYGYEGNTNGFTFANYQQQIDNGNPVLIHVAGHTMLGVGYDASNNKVYLHDTWDYNTHEMIWGGSYSDMQHYGVTVIELEAPVSNDYFTISNVGSQSLNISSITSNKSWLTISAAPPTPFTISPSNSQQVNVNVDWILLGTAQDTGYITIASDDPDEPTISVTVIAIPVPLYFPPPRNLEGIANGQYVNLNWDPPLIMTPAFKGEFPTVVNSDKSTGEYSLGRAPLSGAPSAKPADITMTRGSVAYATDCLNHIFGTIDIEYPGIMTQLSTFTEDYYCGDFGIINNDMFYVIDNATSTLKVVDINTGVFTTVGAVSGGSGHTWTGMAMDKNEGIMYASSTDGDGSTIYTVDLETGNTTIIGNPAIDGIIDIAIDGNGVLYATDIITDKAYTIDKITATANPIGDLGINLNYAQGLSWDPVTDLVYIAAYTTTAELYILDTNTGAAGLVGAFPDGSEICAFGFQGGGSGYVPENLIAYKIFKNDTFYAQVNADTTEYITDSLTYGSYNFSVSALYGDPSPGESDPTPNITVEILNPPITISGTVTGENNPLQNVMFVSKDQNNVPLDTCYSNTNGLYQISVPYMFSGSIVPYLNGYIFSPEYRNYSDVTVNISNENYTATAMGYVEIGDGSLEGYRTPVNNYYQYSRTQSIYLQSEIGIDNPTNLIEIGYNLATWDGDPYTYSQIQIWMGHTTMDQYGSNADWVDVSTLQMVYDGPMSFSDTGWIELQLDIPFLYNGVDNLIISVYDPLNTPSYAGSGNKWSLTDLNNGIRRVLLGYSDGTSYPNLTSSTSYMDQLADLRLYYAPIGYDVTFNVTTSDSASAEGALVTLTSTTNPNTIYQDGCDSNGIVEFTDIESDDYSLSVFLSGYELYTDSITIDSDTTKNVLLQKALAPPVNLTAEVVDYSNVLLEWNPPDNNQLLWNQIDNLGETYGKSAQDFEADYDVYDAEVAADFVLTEATTLLKAAFRYFYNAAGTGNLDPRVFNVAIFTDESGAPGETPLYTTTTVAATPDDNNVFEGEFVDPISLEAGTYWIGFSMQLDYGTLLIQCYAGQRAALDNGTPAYWRNPGDGFGSGFTTWTQEIKSESGTPEDICFALYGLSATKKDLAAMADYPDIEKQVYYRSASLNVAVNGICKQPSTPRVVNNKSLIGYNVYRDSLSIADSISALSYLDTGLAPGVYSYQVSALYPDGESELEGPVSVYITGPDPDISVNPTSLSHSVISDSTIIDGFYISNDGLADLIFTIDDIQTSNSSQVQSISIRNTGGEQFITRSKQTGDNPNDYIDYLVSSASKESRDVSWLSESPLAGTVVPGDSTLITVTFNSAGLSNGIHSANILISSNDPDEDLIVVPATLTKSTSNFTTDDNEDNAFTGIPDFDMDTYLYNYDAVSPIEFNIFIQESSITNAQLSIYAWDIDETDGEVDEVYLNGNYLGTLTGADQEWSTTVLNVNPSFLTTGPGGKNLIQVFIDVNNDGWAVSVDWGQLIINGGSSSHAYIRYADLDKTVYQPGENVAVTTEVDTDLVSQQVIVETNLLNPNNVNIDGTSSTITIQLTNNEPLAEILTLPSSSPDGTYNAQIIVYDAVTYVQEDIIMVPFEVSSPNQYVISTSSSPAAGGSTSGGGTYTQGTQCCISATPATDYTFSHWVENGSIISSNSSFCFTVNEDRELVAVFEYNNILQHFIPVWSGGALNPMTITVTKAMFDEMDLQSGDEIGVFDGNACVGAAVISQIINPSNNLTYVYITCSKDDPDTPEIDGYTVGNTISYRLWDTSDENECQNANATFPYSPNYQFTTFVENETAIVQLVCVTEITQTIPLVSGWNILSYNITPPDMSLMNIMSDLITSNSLVKVIDEQGAIMQELPWGWVNNIGNMNNTEGYYTKVSSSAQHQLTGTPVSLPFSIPLFSGWNIMGYPCQNAQDAMTVLQPLVNSDELVKVIDESGNIIQQLPFGWVNNIGNLNPGEGYLIKVSSSATLNFTEGSKNVATMQPKKNPLFFVPEIQGNPYMPSTFVLEHNLTGENLEVGLFIDDICVDACVVEDRYLYFSVTTDEELSFVGKSPELKLYNPTNSNIVNLDVECIYGSPTVAPLETTILKTKESTGIDDLNVFSSLKLYPNPAQTNVCIDVVSKKPIDVDILMESIDGAAVHSIKNTSLVKGSNKVTIDVSQFPKGIYQIRILYNNGFSLRKMLIIQ